MLAFFGLGPTELIILAVMGLVPLVVIVVVLMAVRRSSSSGRGDPSNNFATPISHMSAQWPTAAAWFAEKVRTRSGSKSVPAQTFNFPVCSNPCEKPPVPQNKSSTGIAVAGNGSRRGNTKADSGRAVT